MSKRIVVAFAVVLALALCACSSGTPSAGQQASESAAAQPAEPLNLEGKWVQVNGEDGGTIQVAVIDGGTMTIEWVNDAKETRSLYWAGTYDAPTEPSDTWSWTSSADHDRTDSALLASSSDTKDFKYEDGQIVYESSMMGTTWTVRLERA